MSTTLDPVAATIVAVAQQHGVDPRLALADAEQESGLNPSAVGDQGTSFGLYQLHEGGELGALTPQQAFDPATNAGVALGVMGTVASTHPGADPGTIAALAERPANAGAYAASVDRIYNNPNFFPTVGAAGSNGSAPSTTPAATPSTAATTVGLLTNPVGTVKKAAGYIVLVSAGAGMVLLGVWKAANPGQSARSLITAAGTTATKAAEVTA